MYETWGQELADWEEVVERSELSLAGISRKFDIAYSNLVNWFHHGSVPTRKSKEKMEVVLQKLKETQRIPFHPSYGYATASQIDRLRASITQYEREQILQT